MRSGLPPPPVFKSSGRRRRRAWHDPRMRVAVAFDHRGVSLREAVLDARPVTRRSTSAPIDASVRIDYPDKAAQQASAMINGGDADRGDHRLRQRRQVRRRGEQDRGDPVRDLSRRLQRPSGRRARRHERALRSGSRDRRRLGRQRSGRRLPWRPVRRAATATSARLAKVAAIERVMSDRLIRDSKRSVPSASRRGSTSLARLRALGGSCSAAMVARGHGDGAHVEPHDLQQPRSPPRPLRRADSTALEYAPTTLARSSSTLAIADVRDACDVLRPVWDRTEAPTVTRRSRSTPASRSTRRRPSSRRSTCTRASTGRTSTSRSRPRARACPRSRIRSPPASRST